MKLGAILRALLAFACHTNEPAYIEGGLYSAPGDGGKYIVLKILKLDPDGVHVRMYSNLFDNRPRDVDETKLSLAGVDHKPTEALGMGRVQPHSVALELVRPDAKGGYFK